MSVKSQSGSIASSIKKGVASKVSDDGLDDDVDEKGVTKRKSRNLSEKKRRDQFNLLIHELCSVVCSGKRKMDKSTILKSAISFIRNHNQATSQNNCPSRCSGTDDWKPSFLSNEEFTHLMLEALDEFVIVLSGRNGRIVYVSENITSLLGHLPNELIGSVVTDLIWEEERPIVEEFLGSRRSSEQQEPSKNEHINFSCHLRRGNAIDGASGNVYEMVYFSGYYRIQSNPEIPSMSRVSSAWGDDSKESASYGDSLSQYNGLVFVASARLQTPQLLVEMSIIDVSKSEFTSRHSLEWKFLFLDHRGPPIIGYLPFEVLGTSGYDYYHVDDLEKVSACHEALMQKGEVTSCCYRFLTKGQQWIWLQTKYYITYHQWYSKPEFIVCTHRVISYNDVTGHPLKLEAEEAEVSSDAPCPSTPVPLNKFRAEMKSFFASSRDNKPSEKLRMQAGSFSGGVNVKKNSILAQPSKSSIKKHTSNHLPRHKRSSSTNEAHQVLSPSRESFQSCTTPMMSHDSSQQSKQAPHSHMGVALSDTGSFSSSTSFQSAASQHSRHSDASMHSIHSQQSHHSMQSVHSQHTQHSQHSQQSMQRPSSQACSAHSCVSMTHNHSQPPISQYQHQQQQQQHQSSNYSRPQASHVSGGDMEIHQMESNTESYDLGEHRFLQPRINSVGQVAASSRNFGMMSMPNHATVNTVASSSHAVTTTAASVGPFGYQTMENNSMAQTGVTLPVQRVIEGLPVVSLPGIVAHEQRMLTAAQREQQERLRMKHLEIQKSIMAQQEELRRISEQLLLSTWGPSVLKMSVPEGDGNVASSSQTTHVGLIGNSSSGQMTFSPGTSILVHSPELYHALSPDRTGESLCLSTDPSQVVLRTALQQETLVQISQQDIQMLLAQSLLQENPPSSSDYLPQN